MFSNLKKWHQKIKLPKRAKEAIRNDASNPSIIDPGIDLAIDKITDWLCDAQDNSKSADGGVARDYSLLTGWATSYPETTGYIIPTLIKVAHLRNNPQLLERTQRMLKWCESIQLDDGGFQGGRIDAKPIVSVTFNTGQILIGLAAGVSEFNAYHESMHKAARFLRDSLDDDGCWRKHPTPFAKSGEKAYETHVSWGLFEAERVAPGKGYAEAGLKQVRWALTKQQENGWVEDCCLNDPIHPLTHTLGYFLRGLIEAHRFSMEPNLLETAKLTADGLLSAQRPNGSLPGRLRSDWSPAVSWSCLTGNVQIAECWLYLFNVTGIENYARAALAANSFVRRTISLDGISGVRGGVKGSFPINGDYGSFEYLNWAAKFTIDSCIAESTVNKEN